MSHQPKPAAEDCLRELEALKNQLAESEARYRELVDNVTARIVSLDTEGRIRFVNRLAHRATPAPIEGKRFVDSLPEPCREDFEATLQAATERGVAGSCEIKALDGTAYRSAVVPVKHEGVFRGVLIISMDMTEQHRIEQELRASESRYRSLVEGLPDNIGVIDTERRVLYLNRTGPTMTLEQVLGRDVLDLMPEESRDVAREAIARAFATQQLTHYQTGVEGADRIYACRVAPVLEDGKVSSAVVIGTDITERLRTEERLRLTERLSSMGCLVAGLAHEIQNPLTYVLGNLQYALGKIETIRSGGDPEAWSRHEKVLREALEGARRASSIVSDLRSFSRGEDDSDSGEVDLREVLQSSLRMASNEIRHRAELRLDIDGAPPAAGSSSRLGQVFLNLVVNAAQAIPEGAAHENYIEVRAAATDADRVSVEVKDTGDGISPEIESRIFDPFFTTKDVGEGTGLGLSICNQIVMELGGELTFESTPGVGTIFRVDLPRHSGAAAEARQQEQATQRFRVMIIDDDRNVLNTASLAFEEHEVVGVTSAREALKILERDTNFDRILCDLMMPEMPGWDFHAVLCDRPGELQDLIVFMTGGSLSPRARRFLSSVDNPCIDKPFDLVELEERVLEGKR